MTGELKRVVGRVGTALLLCCTLGGCNCLAQDVRVRVIDVKTGQAIGGKRIRIELGDDKTRDTSHLLDPRQAQDLKTGSDGVATFQLKPPLPKRLIVILAIGSWTQCSPYSFPVDRVLKLGIVAENQCKPRTSKQQEYTTEPGEIVVFTQYINRLERLKEFPR